MIADKDKMFHRIPPNMNRNQSLPRLSMDVDVKDAGHRYSIYSGLTSTDRRMRIFSRSFSRSASVRFL